MHADDAPTDTPATNPADALRNRRTATAQSRAKQAKKPPLGTRSTTTPAKSDPPAEPPTPDDRTPGTPPETSPELADPRPEVGNKIDKLLKDAIAYAARHIGTSQADTMLDESIFAMRKRGLSIPEIARHFEGTLSEHDIEQRIARQLANFAALSTSEYRALQVARLEDVINMCYDYARGGSEEHVKMLLLAIERLNKMFELESTKTMIEINLVTSQQSALILSIMDAILRIVLTNPAITAAFKATQNADPNSGIEPVTQDVIEAITGEALDVATEHLINAQHSMLELDLSQETSRIIEGAAS